MAINTQKFLPASKSIALAKIEPKSSALAKISQKTVSTQGFSSIFSGKTIKNISVIKIKVIQIEKILKGTIALEKKSLDEKKRKDSGTRREKQEEKLETKPNVEKGNIKMPSAPRLGILDWVKNFIGNVILGYFAVRLIDHLPKIMPIVKFLGAAADFIIDIGGKLLNGLVTFIDWGYKAYDATRGFIKNLGGENFAKGFDKFTGLIDTALFLTTVLAGSMAIEAMTGDGGGPGGDLRGKPKPGTGGRPKVTTTGGGGTGKPDIRNPLRQKPKVTTGGGGRKFKLPKGTRAGGLIGLVMLIPDLINAGMLVSQGRSKDGIRTLISTVAGVGAGMAAYAGVLAGAAALGVGTLGLGIPAAIALAIAGFGASSLAGWAAYEGSEILLKKMGLVDNDPKTGKPYTYKGGGGITRGGKTQGKIKRTIKKPKRTIKTLPSKVKPGQSIGGEKKIKNIFPEVKSEDKGKKINTYGYMKSSYEKLSSAEAFGGLFALPLKAQLGEEPSKLDYQNAASGLNSWMQRTFSSEIMRTGGVGFAEGGKVEAGMFSNGEDMTKIISKSLEESISSKVTAAINDLKKQLGLKPDEKDGKKGDEKSDESGMSGTGDYSPEGLQGEIYKYLISKGMDDAHAIGIMANISRESGFRPGVSQSGGPGVGLFQYSDNDRKPKFLKAVPNYANDWKGQIDYALKEDYAPQYLKRSFSSSQEAADVWMKEWERPAEDIQNVSGPKIHAEYIKSLEKYRTKKGTLDFPKGADLGTQSGSLSEAKSLAESMKVPLYSHVRKDNPNSYHYDGRAMDFSNDGVGNGTPEQLALAKEYVKRYGATAKEIFYTPLGFSIKDGKKVSPIAASGHYNHVHVAFAKGGRVTEPTYAMIGEEGEEFIFDADTTKGLDGMAPLLLDRLNTASSKPKLMNVLQSYFRGNTQIAATYGGESAEQQQKIGAVMKGKPAGKGFQGRFNVFGRGHNTDTGRLKLQDNIPPKQDNQIAATSGEGGFPMKNFMDFLEKQKNYQKNNITYDSRPSIAKLAQKPLSPSSPQIASYTSYEQSYPSEVFIPIEIPVPTGGGGNSSGSSGGIIIAMGGGSNPFDSLYKGG